MGRRPGFDAAQVIAVSRNLFWSSGFDAVSVSDVEAATGLSRSSLYHAFGSMRGLFDAAVNDYLDNVVRPRLSALRGDDVDGDALPDYLRGLSAAIEHLERSDAPTGCLLIGTASGTLATDDTIRRVIADYHAELLAAITRGVRARYPSDTDPEVSARATAITGAVVAAMTLARVDSAAAVDLVDVTLATLR